MANSDKGYCVECGEDVFTQRKDGLCEYCRTKTDKEINRKMKQRNKERMQYTLKEKE